MSPKTKTRKPLTAEQRLKYNKTRNAVYHKNKKEISVECEFCGKHYVMGSANHTTLTLHNSPIRCIQCANGKWSLSKLRTEALKYKTQKDFYTLGRRAYSVAHRKGLLGIIGDHLTSTIKENIFKKLVDIPGIYYLMQKEEIVYIGKSVQCMSRRLCYHLEDSFKHFDRVKAYIIKNDADINVAELYLINKYKPRYNKGDIGKTKLTLVIENIDNIIQDIIEIKIRQEEEK